MIPAELELRLHRFLALLWSKLRESREAEQALRSALRETATFLEASAASLSVVSPGRRRARLTFAIGEEDDWDLELLARFFRDQRPTIPAGLQLAPVHRRGRPWRVLALRRPAERIDGDQRWALSQIARTISQIVRQIDRERIAEVRSRIERKVMEELRPKDLFYQILHGLRTLTRYDHSAALLISGDRAEGLELVAEQIAWRKGKSDKIGMRLLLDAETDGPMRSGRIYGFERSGGTWRDWTGHGGGALAGLLDYNAVEGESGTDRREAAMLCAPLVMRDGVLAVLKVASQHRGSLGAYEAELVARFMPQVAVALQNSRRTESLEAQMLQAERKHVMADLARAVAHDLNNALGSVLPLVQQLRLDCQEDRVDPAVLSEDLREIERALQVCTRIFGGMLAFSRGGARGSRPVRVRPAVENAMAILRDGMVRRRIECGVELPADLPAVAGAQTDLEQVLLNLLSNARDAMPQGGRLLVRGRALDGRVELEIEDTGIGIPREDLPRILEPFYTTKRHGNGLGLSICRSILWSMGGRMEIDSERGRGTRIVVQLPAAAPREAKAENRCDAGS